MSEINVGEYVRTNRGIIAKVIYIREATRYRCTSGTISHSPERYFLDNEQKHSVSSGYVKAHSKNIVDLIEEGDIVELINGLNKNEFIRIQYSSELDIIKSHKIISILTHELYGQNSYKVGDIE